MAERITTARPYAKAIFALASKAPENTGEVLLSIMERRLDNIVHRLGFAPSRYAARQLVKLNLQESPPPVPDYLERTEGEPPEGRLTRLPTRGDIDPRIQEIREQLIIEFCAR